MTTQEKTAVVITSISPPDERLAAISRGCQRAGFTFILVGDESSPGDFQLAGCRFVGLDDREAAELSFARACPTRHYARKNIGYLLAAMSGSTVIRETDDDNVPLDKFWIEPSLLQSVSRVSVSGWVNVYSYFTDARIWPRGLPLETIGAVPPAFDSLRVESRACPIQQGLSNENPDVDAIYRLLMPLPQSFSGGRRIALASGTWSPFNSQNTTWWKDAFPLMYLPAYCSFRMTDIWRSFVAQRIAWENDWMVMFDEPTMRQERNAHDLMKDFRDEVPGYLHNSSIAASLSSLRLDRGIERIPANMKVCYERLVSDGIMDSRELPLLDAFLSDLSRVT
jgi:hypothetical protein